MFVAMETGIKYTKSLRSVESGYSIAMLIRNLDAISMGWLVTGWGEGKGYYEDGEATVFIGVPYSINLKV